MDLHVVKLNPSGNTTLFVTDPVPKEKRAAVARALMDTTCFAAEQVGFLAEEAPRAADIFVSMMGGEFCGNAVRAASALRYFKAREDGETAVYDVCCSGLSHNVRTSVRRISRTVFDVTAEMPKPLSIETVRVREETFCRVALSGIAALLLCNRKDAECFRKRNIDTRRLGKISDGRRRRDRNSFL